MVELNSKPDLLAMRLVSLAIQYFHSSDKFSILNNAFFSNMSQVFSILTGLWLSEGSKLILKGSS